MNIITWVKERYVIFLLLRAEHLQQRADDYRRAAYLYAYRANLIDNKIHGHRYRLSRQCAKCSRRAYTLGAKAAAAEAKAHNFICKHKLKGFD